MEENYKELFDPELNELNTQAVKTDELYNETHQALEKNINRMNDKSMFGTSSPYRDISELSKSLTSIRQTSISIIREKISLKQIIQNLILKSAQIKSDSKTANVNESLMRNILTEINRKTELRPTHNELTNNNGIEHLDKYKIDELGLNDNDLKMIEKFRGSTTASCDEIK